MKQTLIHRLHDPTQRYCLWLFCIAIFYAAVCTPVYQWSSADIAISSTVFPVIWDTLQSVIRFLFYWICAALMLFTVQHGKSTRRVFLLAGAASALLQLGSLAAGLLLMRDTDALGNDLLDVGLSVLLDLLQLGVFRLVAHLTLESKRTPARQERSMTHAVLWCATTPSILQIVGRICYDIAIGLPTGKADLIWMIAYYLSDLVSIAVGYLIVLLLEDRLEQTTTEGEQKKL